MRDHSINVDYGYARLAQALQAASTHQDQATRQRARTRARQWAQVIEGMQTGTLRVGSRTPTQYPAWVTLEVVHGGFATGAALAASPISTEEQALVTTLGLNADRPRFELNRYFLSDAGHERLLTALAEYRLRIDLPEHGALVVIAWLMAQGAAAEALEVLEAIEPWFSALRFYPEVRSAPHHAGSVVRRMTVGDLIVKLDARQTPQPVRVMNEALQVWGPLYDRLVALWSQTVEGDPPMRAGDGVTGGWPCQRWPADWYPQRMAWLADYAAAAAAHTACRSHRHPKSNFYRLHQALVRCAHDSRGLTGRDVGWVRRALANTHRSKGVIGGAERTALRRAQALHAARPPRRAFNEVLIGRLGKWPLEGGLPTLEGFDQPVESAEHPQLPVGTALPRALTRRVAFAYEAPLAELADRGIVGSGELLATFVPQITASQRSAGFADPAVRALYEAIYLAFRQRRSLLLLDYASQVRLEELPWVQALCTQQRDDLDTRTIARNALRELVVLYLTRFPQTITPNPLVVEFVGLARQAGLTLPLCNELAADIFMGGFTDKWRQAALVTQRMLADTLYGRYFDLPDRVPLDMGRWCTQRAFPNPLKRAGWSVARNGCIIEQSQIVTTHNLAVLVDGLELGDTLRPLTAGLARQALEWAIAAVGGLPPDRRGQLLAIKNAAYAWRQGIFFLSLASSAEAVALIDALDETAEAASIQSLLKGVRHALNGGRFAANGQAEGGGRRFVGWCTDTHWLMG